MPVIRRVQGRRRRLALVVAAVVSVAAVVAAFSPTATAVPTLDKDITHYALFAQKFIKMKGNDGGGAHINNGNVGVNQPFGTINMCGGGSGHSVTMSPNSQIVSWTMTLGSECALGQTDAFYSELGSATIQGTVRSKNKMPAQTWGASLNGLLDPHPGDADYHFFHPAWPQQATCKGTLTLGTGASVTLNTDGQVLCNVMVGKNATLTIGQNVHTLWVLGWVNFGNGAHINDGNLGKPIQPNVQWYVRGDGVDVNSNAVNFGKQTSFVGDIDALGASLYGGVNGGINLGNSTKLVGHFWGYSIASDWDVQVTPPPYTTTSTTTSSSSSSSSTTVTTVGGIIP